MTGIIDPEIAAIIEAGRNRSNPNAPAVVYIPKWEFSSLAERLLVADRSLMDSEGRKLGGVRSIAEAHDLTLRALEAFTGRKVEVV